MPSLPDSKHALILSPAKLKHALRVTAATSQMPERDVMLLWLTHTTGLRVSEISQITIADLMFSSGKLRKEIYLRSAITKHCRARTVYLTHEKAIHAVECWLAYRATRKWECGSGDEYRGFWPHSTLVLTFKGRAFELTRKRRKLESGVIEEYRCCDALQQSMSRLYRKAGIKGSSHSGRRSLANRVLTQTGSIENVQLVLGHASIDHCWPYLDVDKTVIRRAFEIAL